MALQTNIELHFFDNTVILESVYVRVGEISGDKTELTFLVESYKSGDDLTLINTEIYKFKPDVSDSALNFIKQIYLHLKTMPKFADAIDC